MTGLSEESDFLLELGISKLQWTAQDKPVLVRMCEHLVISKCKAALDQFVEGFKSVDAHFFECNKINAPLFHDLFCHSEEQLTASKFRQLFHVCFSPEGSNDREGQEQTCLWWEELIDEGIIPFPKIFEFASGCREVPPLGFDKKIDIKFYNQDGKARPFPWTSTCSLEMSLPRAVENYTEFKELIEQALSNTCGFGKI